MENTQKGHPKGLYVLFITEMWERFSYYGMRAIFTLFLIKALLFNKDSASSIYGSYTGLVYLTPLLGGYIADKLWGNRRAIIFGGFLMAIGQFLMFLSGTMYTTDLGTPLMLGGLGFLIFGNGFFKPNISTMVGQLYAKGDKRVDSAFTIFYMGINLGAFIAPLWCGLVGDTGDPADFKWGFLSACIGMLISLALFITLKDKYIVTPDGQPVGMSPKAAGSAEAVDANAPKSTNNAFRTGLAVLTLVAAAVGLQILMDDIITSVILGVFFAAPVWIIPDNSLTKQERDRIIVVFLMSFFVIFFWSAFEQAGASLTFFAEEQTNRMLGSFEIPASWFQSVNAVAIVIFAPIFAVLWTTLGKRNSEPGSLVKQAIGLLLLALGYLYIAIMVKDLDPSVKNGMMVLINLYLIHTFGELCLSPIGLSMVVKLSPMRLASLMMGVWFLSTAAANKGAGELSKLYPAEVKMEESWEAPKPTFAIAGDTTAPAGHVMDSTFWKTQVKFDSAAKAEFKKQYKDDKGGGADKLAQGAAMEVWTVVLDSAKNDKGKMKKFAKSITSAPANASLAANLPAYKFKQIIPAEPDGAFKTGLSADGKHLYVFKSRGVLEMHNLFPTKPSFMGFEITTLYEFFMIFVVLAGIAAVILFLLTFKLKKMMHGADDGE